MANKYDEIMGQFEGTAQLPSATDSQLNDVETRLGYKLPPDYRRVSEGLWGLLIL